MQSKSQGESTVFIHSVNTTEIWDRAWMNLPHLANTLSCPAWNFQQRGAGSETQDEETRGNGKEEKEGSVAQRRGPSEPWGLSLSCDRRDLSSRLRGQGGSEPHLPAEPPTIHSREEATGG